MEQKINRTGKSKLNTKILKFIFLISICLILLLPISAAEDWPMFRHDLEHTGETSDVIQNPENMELFWKFKTGDWVRSSPSVSGDFVYVGSQDNYVYCLNKNTSEVVWKFKTDNWVRSSPAISENFVYVSSEDGYVYCLNKNTGRLVWKFKTDNWVRSSPAISENFVYVSSEDGYVYCLNKNTGRLVWKFKTDNWVRSSPAISENFVYISSWDNYIYCLNKDTGEVIWKFKTEMAARSSPAISQNFLYFGSDDNYTYCLNKNTAEVIWKFKTEKPVDSSPAISGNFLYLGSDDGYVYCLNKNTGELVWKFKTGDWVRSSPAIAQNFVYVGSADGHLYCLNKNTGELVWKFNTGNWVRSSPAISGNFVYVGSWNNYVYCLNKNTGEEIWKFKTGNFVYSSPAISGNFVYVGSDDSYVYAFVALKSVNSSCSANSECKSGNCFKEMCKTPGYGCNSDSDCFLERYCSNNKCVNLKENGSACSSDSECETKICFKGVCKEQRYECNSDSDCSSGKYCLNNTCEDSKKVCLICFANSECESSNCFKGKCREQGVVCDLDSDCSSGKYCSNNKCFYLKQIGSACFRNSECESGNCFKGICREQGYIDSVWFLIIGGVIFLAIGIKLVTKRKKYLFSWDDVPENNTELIKFLMSDLKIEWVENAEIRKNDNNETITVTSKTNSANSVTFKLNKTEKKVSLFIERRTYEYILKEENGKLNIYIKEKFGIENYHEKINLQKDELKRKMDLLNREGFESDAEQLKTEIENIRNEDEIGEIEEKVNALKIRIDEEKRIKTEQEEQSRQQKLTQQKEELHKKLYLLDPKDFESDVKQLRFKIDHIGNEKDVKEIEEKVNALKTRIDEEKRIKAEQEGINQQQERTKTEESEKEKPKKQYYASFSKTFPDELNKYYSNPEFIGEGGFAYVFKAVSNEYKRLVAIKIPKEMNEKTGELFLKEISIWNFLNHRNIIKLYKANIYPCPYLEIEYVNGNSLENIKKPIGLEKASKLINDLLEGLKEAHSKNIYHLDLKPDNILLTLNGEPKITDWGLSKIAKHSKYSAVTGQTIMYSAPELISPEDFGKADCRTDIFQIGTIFYELVTGKNPFDGDTQSQIITNILMKTPKKPSEINPDTKELEGIIMKCIEKKKENRYQNVSELQKDLTEYLKIKYKESLRESKSTGDIKRSSIYCGELLTVFVSQNNTEEALKYAIDFKNYAKGEFKNDIDNIIEQLKYRMNEKMDIGDELQKKINIVTYQIKMGREN